MKPWMFIALYIFGAMVAQLNTTEIDNHSDLDFYLFKTFGSHYDSDFNEPFETYDTSYHHSDSFDENLNGSDDSSGSSHSDSLENNNGYSSDNKVATNDGDSAHYFSGEIIESGGSTESSEDKTSEHKIFNPVDPDQKHLIESRDYVAPEDVEYRLSRHKRSEKPQLKSQEMDENNDNDNYDGYSKTYRDFVRAHFGNNEDDLNDDNNSGSEETTKTRAGDVKQNENDESDEDGDETDSDSDNEETNEEKDDETINDPDYQRVKKLSDRESREGKRTPQYCKVVHKDDQECTICRNPKTHDTSESCSYSSSPAPKRYAFKRQKNYNSKGSEGDRDDDDDRVNNDHNDDDDNNNDDDNDDDNDDRYKNRNSDTVKKPKKNAPNKKMYNGYEVHEDETDNEDEDEFNKKTRKPMQKSKKSKTNKKSKKSKNYNQVEEKIRAYENPNYYGNYYGNQDRNTNSPLRSHHLTDFDEDLAFRASEPQAVTTPTDSNVAKVLESFKSRDWSQCKHKRDNGITCYYCKEADGSTQEECIYSSDFENDDDNMDKKDIASIFKSKSKPKSKPKNNQKTTPKPFFAPDKSVYKNPSSIMENFNNNNNQRKLNRNQNFKMNPTIANAYQDNLNVDKSFGPKQHQDKSHNRRSFETELSPITTLEYIEPTNKRTSKRMVSYKQEDTRHPVENKSLFYSKIIHLNKN